MDRLGVLVEQTKLTSVDRRLAAIELAQADCLRAVFHSIAVKAAFLERRI